MGNNFRDLIFEKNNNLFIFCYIPIKLLAICLIFLVSSLFSDSIGQFNSNYSIFYQVDGPQSYFGCDLNSANILFTITSCLLDIKSSSAITAICTAIIITLMRDFIFFVCAKHILKSLGLIIFLVLLASHPYLALYSVKYTTDVFACLAIAILFYQILFDKKNILFNFFAIIFVGFRNNLMPIFIIFYIIDIIRSFRENNLKNIFIYFLTVLLVYLISQSTSGSYDSRYIDILIFSDQNPYSWYEIVNYFNLQHDILSYLLVSPILVISHLILLTGFRESVFVLGLDFLIDLGVSGYIQLFIYSALSLFHILGISYFYFKFYKIKPILFVFLLYFIPTFVAVAHLRYFFPLIPFALIGISFLIENNYKKNNYETN